MSAITSADMKEYFFSMKDTFECMSWILAVSYFLRYANILPLLDVLVIRSKSMPHAEGCFEFLFAG